MTLDVAAAPAATTGAGSVRNATIVLVGISFLHNLDRTVMSGLLEPVKHAFNLSDAAVGALSGAAFGLAYASLGLPLARLVDTVDRRKLLAVALGVWSALTMLCGFATGFWTFFVARFGVAVFEAAGAPAVHALTADSVPSAKRPGAASLLTVGATLGAIVGVTAGGVIADHYGWRLSFWMAGLPGLVLTPIALIFLIEPRRRAAPFQASDLVGAAMRQSVRNLLGRPALIQMLIATGLMVFWLYGTATWFTTFLIRDRGLSLSAAALGYGLLSGGSSVVGVALGGWLGNRLLPRDPRWYGRLPALCMALTFVFAAPVYLVAGAAPALGLYVIANVFYGAGMASMYPAIYALSGTANRALGLSVLNFCNYLVGLGLAPFVVGAISDALAPGFGHRSLALSLLAATAVLPLSAIFWLRCGSRFGRDMQPD